MSAVVSIIIVNYNTCQLTLECLSSVFAQTNNISFEVIVIDNASTDCSCKSIEEKFPQVKIIRSDKNLGFGKANNLGAKHACGKYLLLLNSDTILLENSVKKLSEYIESSDEPTIGVIGCNILDANKNNAASYGNFPSVLQEIFEYGPSRLFKKYYRNNLSISVIDNGKQIKNVDYITGACMFFKKEIFNKFGGFDEEFFLYYEETELCFRLARSGYKIIWYPHTSLIHYEGASGAKRTGINYVTFQMYYESKYLYFKKCHGNLIATFIKYLSIPKILRIYRKFDTGRILKILLKAGVGT